MMNSYFKRNGDYTEPETFRASNDYVPSVEMTASVDGIFPNNVRNSVSLPK